MIKRPKILVVGSFMMDLIVSAQRVPNMGETVIGTSFKTAPGGKGANQAVQCARLGADVTMVGCVGTDAFGDELLAAVNDSGVNTTRVKRCEGQSSGVGNIQLQVVGSSTENRILVVPGANMFLTPDDLAWMTSEISNYDMLMLQLEIPMETTKFAACCAHNANVPVMLNPAPAAYLDSELMSYVTYISPNEHEAAILTKESAETMDNAGLLSTVSKLHAAGAENVLITLGERGSILSDGANIERCECVHMDEVKDPTAAGDSFIAAFCTGITSGMKPYQALAFASHTAAITVSQLGAMPSLPTIGEVKTLMREKQYTGIDFSQFEFCRESEYTI